MDWAHYIISKPMRKRPTVPTRNIYTSHLLRVMYGSGGQFPLSSWSLGLLHAVLGAGGGGRGGTVTVRLAMWRLQTLSRPDPGLTLHYIFLTGVSTVLRHHRHDSLGARPTWQSGDKDRHDRSETRTV